jgi:hypothetical protein
MYGQPVDFAPLVINKKNTIMFTLMQTVTISSEVGAAISVESFCYIASTYVASAVSTTAWWHQTQQQHTSQPTQKLFSITATVIASHAVHTPDKQRESAF